MTDLVIKTDALYLPAEPGEQRKITNVSGDTLYYDDASSVSSSSNDGNLTADQSLTISSGTWVVSAGATRIALTEVSYDADLLQQADDGYFELDTGVGKVRFGDTPNLADGRTGIEFTSDDSSWVGFEHETNFHLNAYGSFFNIRTSSNAFNVCAGDAAGGATSTYFSVDTTNGIVFANGKLQFGSLSGSDTALERNAVGRVGTVSGVGFIANTADLYAQATTGATAARLGAVGPSSQAGVLFGEDAGFYRSAANTVKTDDALVVDSSIQSNGVVVLTNSGTSGYIEAREQSPDPDAPSADRGRLFFKDNGLGKTQLVARFATGAVQIVATEP